MSKITINEKSSRTSSLNDIEINSVTKNDFPHPAQNDETEFWKQVFIFIQIILYVQKIQYIPIDGDICSTFEKSFSANFWFIIAQHHSRKSKMDENGKKFRVNFLPVFQNFTNGLSLGPTFRVKLMMEDHWRLISNLCAMNFIYEWTSSSLDEIKQFSSVAFLLKYVNAIFHDRKATGSELLTALAIWLDLQPSRLSEVHCCRPSCVGASMSETEFPPLRTMLV